MTTAIPVPLVTALLNDRGAVVRPAPEYVVGSLPARYPSSLVPRGLITIVGGMTNGDDVVAVFADSTRRLAAVFEQFFEEAGFVRPSPTPASGFWPASGPWAYFCRDSETVSADPLTGANRNLVRVTYAARRGQRCAPVTSIAKHSDLNVPALTPPPGVRAGRSHSESNNGVSSSTELTGADLMPAAIMAHYAAQLTAAGWTASAPAVGERVSAQFFEAKDESGAAWEGVMMIAGGGPSATASLSMHMRTRP